MEGIDVLYRKPGALPVTTTHAWTGGQRVEKIVLAEATKESTVEGGKLDGNEFVKIEAAAP